MNGNKHVDALRAQALRRMGRVLADIPTARTWQDVETVVARYDRHCKVLLALTMLRCKNHIKAQTSMR